MSPAPYTGNVGPEDAARWLAAKSRVIVFTHARPDGDAAGTSLALVRALRARGQEASAHYVGPVPRWLRDFAGATPMHVSEGVEATHALLASLPPHDAVAVVDTGAWTQLEETRAFLTPRAADTLLVDHHLSGDAEVSPRRLIDPAAAAAAEVLAPLACALMNVDGPARLPRGVAEALFVGLATDTGWFRFSNTRPATLRLAAELMEAGVDQPALFEMIEQQDRAGRPRLLARALATLTLEAGETVALMKLTQADFEACRADSEDTGGFAHHALAVASVRVCVIATEVAGREGRGALTKLSLRSKPGPGAVDVAAVAGRFGGGGHARAAGAKIAAPIDEALARVAAALREALGARA